MDKHIANQEASNGQSESPHKHCLNCGSELQGSYCHICGQERSNKAPTILGFINVFLQETFIWDPRFFKTFWTLIRRPGQLTKDFLAGKIVSQEHPIKLNLFLLFVFITLFIFFAGAEKMTTSVHEITYDERVISTLQLDLLGSDPTYTQKLETSPRDTVYLQAPLLLTKQFPQIISSLEIKEDSGGKALDKWIAILPRVLIEDEIIILSDDNNYYRFNPESQIGMSELELVNSVCSEMVRITSQYLPMLLLLTVPFLSTSLCLVHCKRKLRHLNHFIFALHYTAFLEFLMICIYVLHLTIAPSMDLLEWILIIGSCGYLTIAFKKVYASTWWKSIIKSLLTSLIYFFILLLVFCTICFIACIILAINTDYQ